MSALGSMKQVKVLINGMERFTYVNSFDSTKKLIAVTYDDLASSTAWSKNEERVKVFVDLSCQPLHQTSLNNFKKEGVPYIKK